jgi:endonuclease-3
MAPTEFTSHTVKRVLRRLVGQYGPRTPEAGGRGVDCLVGTILSQNTGAANSSAGFANLKQRFADWDAVADAPVRSIAAAIRTSGLAEIKAPRIRRILRRIRSEHGRIDLQFLRRWESERAYGYLVSFDGVGPKTALCVLLFAFGKNVFPVDTHVARIARRLDWLDEGVSTAKAHEILTPLIRPADRYAMHVLLIAHGRAVCKARRPVCGTCVLQELCPTGKNVQ